MSQKARYEDLAFVNRETTTHGATLTFRADLAVAERLRRLEDLVIRWGMTRRRVDALNEAGGGDDPAMFAEACAQADAATAALLDWEAQR